MRYDLEEADKAVDSDAADAQVENLVDNCVAHRFPTIAWKIGP